MNSTTESRVEKKGDNRWKYVNLRGRIGVLELGFGIVGRKWMKGLLKSKVTILQ